MDNRDQLESEDRVNSRDRRIKSTKSLDTAVKDKRPKGNYCVLVRLLILSFMIIFLFLLTIALTYRHHPQD